MGYYIIFPTQIITLLWLAGKRQNLERAIFELSLSLPLLFDTTRRSISAQFLIHYIMEKDGGN
jgi:hypothetical protein